jgi:AraC-like DNA-binding protein
MHYRVIDPPADVSAWVSLGMAVEFDSAPGPPRPCHFPALVEGGLTVVHEGRFFTESSNGTLVPLPLAFVSRANAAPMTLYRTARLRCSGLRLRPAGTIALLQGSPLVLTQHIGQAADVFGHSWDRTRELLCACPSAVAAVSILFSFARQRLCREIHAQRLLHANALQQAALQAVDPAQATGLGLRQFQRVFAATFGVQPKMFQRVSRVEAVLRDALVDRRGGAELALRHGYYDQSHMARDVRLLVGAPLQDVIRAVRTPETAHWALAVGTSKQQPRVSL